MTEQGPPASALDTDPEYRAAVVDLFAVLAYGELTAFERLAADAAMAPTIDDKAALAGMATAEYRHFLVLRDRLAEPRGRPAGGDGAVPAGPTRTSTSRRLPATGSRAW